MSEMDTPTTPNAAAVQRTLARFSFASGRVRLRTLILLRWLAVAGQTAAVLGIHYIAGFTLPLVYCLLVIGASAAMNLIVSVRFPFAKRLSNREAALYLGFDLAQLFALLLLTGGLENPFVILFLAPIAISAASLDLKSTMALGAFAFVCVTVLAFVHLPLPWHNAPPLEVPELYVAGTWVALVLGLGFTAVYAWRISSEAERMSMALEATRSALAREQHLASLGGLAAAAAHELGTPLATIALVAKELEREIGPDSPLAEDAALLGSQAARCREILTRLSRQPGEGDEHFSQTTLGALLDEIAAPNLGFGVEIAITLTPPTGADDQDEPIIRRQPEIIHSLHNLVENAVDFAHSKVQITASWTAESLVLRIRDDGPGIAAEVLAQLGEPYVSTRRQDDVEAEPGDAVGLGLGFFIAKTLLERTGAKVHAHNPARGGAEVEVTWPRGRIEAVQPPPGPSEQLGE